MFRQVHYCPDSKYKTDTGDRCVAVEIEARNSKRMTLR